MPLCPGMLMLGALPNPGETVQALKVFLDMAEAPKVEEPKAEEVVLAEEPAAEVPAEEPAQEQAVTSAEFEELKAVNKVLHQHTDSQRDDKTVMAYFICKFLDELEEIFKLEGKCESLAIAEDYLSAARWMQKNFPRKSHQIEEIQKWVDDYVYRPGPSLFDNFKNIFPN